MMTNHLKEILQVLALNKNEEWQHGLGTAITDYEEERKWKFVGTTRGAAASCSRMSMVRIVVWSVSM